jgi:hypothetical protein
MKQIDESEVPKGVKKASADHRESISEVLKSFDKQLKPHGLEIVQIDTQTDEYEWYIQKR